MLTGIENANGGWTDLLWLHCVDTLHNKRAQWPHHADSWLTWDWTHCGIWSTLAKTYLYFWIHVNLAGAPVGWDFIFLIQVCCYSYKCIQKILSGNYCTVLSTLLGRALLLFLWLEPPPHFYFNGINVKLKSGLVCWEKGPEFTWQFHSQYSLRKLCYLFYSCHCL